MSKATKAATATATKADEAKAPNAISSHIRNYRANYVPTLGVANRGSLDNDDAIAKTLRTMEPDRVVRVAETALKLGKGILATKYEALNPGMRRMNSGNRIRGAIKRGDLTAAALAKAIKATA